MLVFRRYLPIGPTLDFFQGLEDARGTRIHVDGRQIAPSNNSIGVDDEESPLGSAITVAVDAVLFGHFPFRLEVGKERKKQAALAGEGLMRPRAIDGNTDDLGSVSIELFLQFVVKGHLIAAHRAPIGRIEKNNARPAAEVAQRQLSIGQSRQRESRRLGTWG